MKTTIILCMGLALAPVARAHNAPVHAEMTELAYETMRLARGFGPPVIDALWADLGIEPPPGLTVAEWEAFRAAISAAVPKLQALPAGLNPPRPGTCANEGVTAATPDGWPGKSLGEVDQPISIDYAKRAGNCGLRIDWSPGLPFGTSNSVWPRWDYTGLVLGFHGASIDDEDDDTHLFVRLVSIWGAGPVKKFADEVWKGTVAMALAPFMCLWSAIFGGDNCLSHSQDVANNLDLVKAVDNLFPGLQDVTGSNYTGMWHFINVQPGADNEFDDAEGLSYEDGGWKGMPDPVSMGLMAYFDFTGLSVNYEKSQGPHRYQIYNAGDWHPDSKYRNEADWQFNTAVHTPFTPLDNLAFYGWRNFKNNPSHSARNLAWPLHALGDAVAPHHVIGSSGWGHRPFEDAAQHAWLRLRVSYSEDAAKQQAKRIFVRAIVWRRMILAWRAVHGNDVPVRELITALARQTFYYVMTTMARPDPWPFHLMWSLDYQNNQGEAVSNYADSLSNDMGELTRPLIEEGVAATIAFLTSATEVM